MKIVIDNFIKTISFLLILTLFSSAIIAAELDFSEATDIGKKNNYEIEQKKEAIKELERQRAIIKASVDWHLGLVTDPNIYSSTVPTLSLTGDQKRFGLNLQGGKTTVEGLSITSRLSLNTDLSELENLNKKYNFSLDVSKRLYPVLPTQTEKDFIQINRQLIIAKDELEELENRKEIDWLESYLKRLRLEQRLEYTKLAYQLALDELALQEAQLEIGEVGQEQLLMAQINLQEAKLQKNQLLNSIMQTTDSLVVEFGLTNNSIIYQENEDYIESFRRKVASMNIDTIDKDLLKLIKNNNVQLREIRLNKEYAENELKWQLKDDGIKVDTFSSYDYHAQSKSDKDEWQVGLGISYNFYDGGQQELTVDGIKVKIKKLDKQYAYTMEQLKLQLQEMISEQKLNMMKLDFTKTGLEKARLVARLYKSQFNQGLITENQYKQKTLAVTQAVVDYKEAQDQLLLGKLRIAMFLGLY